MFRLYILNLMSGSGDISRDITEATDRKNNAGVHVSQSIRLMTISFKNSLLKMSYVGRGKTFFYILQTNSRLFSFNFVRELLPY